MAVTRQASTTSATQVLLADSTVMTRVFVNDDANRAYVLIGPGTVSTTNYTFSLATNENACFDQRAMTDRVSVIWGTAGAGGLNVTSL